MLIDILIPTYNREKDLVNNLNYLISEIAEYKLESMVSIIISDNNSQDQTEKSVKTIINNVPQIKIQYFRQIENIGLEKNVVFIFQKAISNHVMFIGDDDFVDKGYLAFCLKQIENNLNLGCIISGIKSVKKNGEERIGRIEEFEYKTLEAGYSSVYHYSHFAHQMSGLVIQNNTVLSLYLEKSEFRNPYLFIYFAAFQLYHFKSVYSPHFKTAIQVENEKDWGYNEIGLLDEVFKSYLYFVKDMKEDQISELLIHFIRMHSYRLNFRSNPIALYKHVLASAPKLAGFKWKLIILFLKEYILRIVKT